MGNTVNQEFAREYSTAKDRRQLAMLEQLSKNPALPAALLTSINSVIKTTPIVEGEPYGLVRRKRRQRNMLLVEATVELELAEKPLGLPYELMLEPTNFCNLQCPLCPTGNGTLARAQGVMTLEQFKGIIDEVEDEVRRIVFWGFGEPFLYREAVEMIRYASDKKMFVLSSTNGTLLNDPDLAREIVSSGLKILYVALDGLTQDVLSKYRVGADIKDILKGIELIKNERKRQKVKKPELILQFVITSDNEHQLPLLETFSQEAGFDSWSVKYANVMTTTDDPNFDSLAQQYIPQNEQHARFKRTAEGKMRIKGEVQNRCSRIFTQALINWDGTVSPCCWDAQAKHIMGNALEERLEDIWFGNKYKEFRNRIFTNRKQIQICSDCPIDRTVEKLSRQFVRKR